MSSVPRRPKTRGMNAIQALTDPRWQAVVERDRAADGQFVYAVETTGVFCRPWCASRQPRRENVRFFGSNAAAERAGFRPCLRCRPTDSDPDRDTTRRITTACRRLEAETPPRLEAIASELGLSAFHLHRLFKKHVGVTPQQYRRRRLLERAKDGLPRASSVTSAIFDAGYSSSSRFYENAGRELGMAPRDAHSGARGQKVSYAIRRCSLGQVLVAWTPAGVCDVRFAAAREELERGLRARFPEAELASRKLPRWIDTVVDAVENPGDGKTALAVPLDIRGTAFQQRVWRELRRIPAGETRTYAELARRLGAPKAARAVGRACATNPVSILVPCHRAVRTSGAMAGYAWGVERKRALLRRESK
jgi:AraC family transcriptional regulator, regulatory protein of adaptative response / methylated-DNA-[protein]-cysteine methyltransferase